VTTTMTAVGLDVHARSTEAAALHLPSGELRRARFGPGLEQVLAWLGELPQPVHACYEAGPTGFGLYRAACEAGIRIDVVAPGKTPRPSSERRKSDRGDAELLARLLPSGALCPIAVPSARLEAARDLSRAREQLRGDLMRARHRLSKLLLRQGRVYPGATTWTQAHRRWLSGQRFCDPNSELAFIDYLAAIDGLCARKAALEERLSRLAREDDLWPTIARLRCFRGIDTLSALVLHLEVHSWERFPAARALPGWLGLVPSLAQSGEHLRQGAITKSGSRYARRILVEAAWHYARPPRIGVTLRNRQQGQPGHVLEIAWRAQHRLYRQGERLRARGKPGPVVTVAIARELACSLWAAVMAP